MTITYTSEVTTAKRFGCFLKLLARWKGSIYKIVWADLLVFLLLYYTLRIIYIFGITTDAEKKYFKNVVEYCDKYSSLIPLSFVLGFYVSLVMTRWWNQYTALPYPDNLAILVGASIKGNGDCPRIVRRTIVRYACLSFTITLSMISPRVKRRFPTFLHLIEAGLLTHEERKIIEELDTDFPTYSKYWLPLAWASSIVTKAREEGLIHDDDSVSIILEELNGFRTKCGRMLDYDWISIPLVYTQVVTLAVYSYFAVTIVGKQYIDGEVDNIHAYFPFLPVFEFFFYMGWLKVAETLINPYGDDDDDFEVAWLIDRHLQISYLLVDKIHHNHPRLVKDMYWSKSLPVHLPHTVASYKSLSGEFPVTSTSNIKVKSTDQDILLFNDSSSDETEYSINASGLIRRNTVRSSGVRRTHSMLQIPLSSIKMENDNKCNNMDINGIIDEDSADTISCMMNKRGEKRGDDTDFQILRRKRLKEKKNRILRYNSSTSLAISPE